MVAGAPAVEGRFSVVQEIQNIRGAGRAYCARSHDGALVGSEEEAVLWVPGRLLLEALRSAELAHWLSDSMLRGGLLPARLPPAAAARQWGAIYMAAEPQARSCC